MANEAKIASADYDTLHLGKSYPCTGTILTAGDGYVLRERIQIGVDRDLGREVFDERSRTLSLAEAKKVLQEWTDHDIAEVLQIPWD